MTDLFSDFKTVNKSEWKTLISKELLKESEWTTVDGIELEEYYDASDKVRNIFSGQQGKRTWINYCKVETYAELQTFLRKYAGTNDKGVICTSDILINNKLDANINCLIKLDNFKKTDELAKCLVNNKISGGLLHNSIDLYKSFSADFSALHLLEDFYTFTIFPGEFQSIPDKVGNLLSCWVDQIEQLKSSNFSNIDKVQFYYPMGSDFFFEVAGIRSLRLLTRRILAVYNFDTSGKSALKIHAHCNNFQDTNLAPNENLIGGTAAAISSIIGGCDSLFLAPENNQKWTSFNTGLILKYEANFDWINDPSNGSFFIEHLTEKMTEKAWSVFIQNEVNNRDSNTKF